MSLQLRTPTPPDPPDKPDLPDKPDQGKSGKGDKSQPGGGNRFALRGKSHYRGVPSQRSRRITCPKTVAPTSSSS